MATHVLAPDGTAYITTGNSSEFTSDGPITTFSATLKGTAGAQTGTVLVEGRLQDLSGSALWTTLATLTLSGTSTDTKTAVYTGKWDSLRYRISIALSGTGAKVYMAYAN